MSSMSPRPRTVAYTMSRFPKLTETFILIEMLELERQGVRIEIFPLIREKAPVQHADAQEMVERAHYCRLLSRPTLDAQVYWLMRRPVAYLRAWWRAVRGNLASPKFLSRALVVVPKAAYAARRMVELEVDHLHAHYATHPALLAYVVNLLTSIPYSFTVHAHDLYVERPMLREKVAAARFVVAISEFNRRMLIDLYGSVAQERVVVVHSGIDPTLFRPRERRDSGAVFTIVCVGSLSGYKGQRYLIDACDLLRKRGMAFQCLLVGEGEDRPLLEAQIERLGLEQHVRLLGAQPRHRVSDILQQADVMVLPSVVMPNGKMEGIPVALMEALASEVPVVATAISGIPELVRDGETGLLVPQRHAAALADALAHLYADRDLGRRLAATGRQLVLREFNLERSAERLRMLFERDRRSSEQGLTVQSVEAS
ncbi:glycosyltransferase family 4 protein [Roseiflexus sp.]|uniref:glycosyltransferase family 4 protein n=1 Tax=Roseiflexus sp. TaxID=2562120 RepID=UPI0021DCB9E9|nr:glycosyltransferase family 4 protein [Roseiflexus sp.]GIW02217.1 MAG: colanic acid biosynthesis glycosyltransferase WcaL [Roseiflexus sp.]